MPDELTGPGGTATGLTLATFYDRRAPAALAYCARVCPPEAIAGAVEASFARALSQGVPDDLDELDRRLRFALRAESADRSIPEDEEGERRRFARGSICARTPRLIVARAAGELSDAELEVLGSHLYTCADCRALERRFDEAERTYEALSGEEAPALGRGLVAELMERLEDREAEGEAGGGEAESGVRSPESGTAEAAMAEPEVGDAPDEPTTDAEGAEPERGTLRDAIARARASTRAFPPPPPPAPRTPDSRLQTPASELPPPASRLPPPASGLRPPVSPLRRRAALVLLIIGLLLLTEVAVTALWKEPFTAYLASQAQGDLHKQLNKLDQLPAHGTAPALARALDQQVHDGDALGEIRIPRMKADYVFVQGTGASSLRKGPSHYHPQTALPGEGQTVGIAGHRTTYGAPFRHIDDLRPGDPIYMRMPYGLFTYSVQYTRIVKPSAKVFGPAGYDRLVLSACHPLFSASERIVVFARLVATRPLGATAPAAPAPRGAAPGAARRIAAAAAQRQAAKRLASLGPATLQIGSRGVAVSALQRLLGIPPTGYFGYDTRAAVSDFQRTHRLPQTGQADLRTKQALARRAHPPSRPPTPAAVAPATPNGNGNRSGSGGPASSQGTQTGPSSGTGTQSGGSTGSTGTQTGGTRQGSGTGR